MVRQFLSSLPLCTIFFFLYLLMVSWFCNFPLISILIFIDIYIGFFHYVVQRKQDKIKIKIKIKN